MIDEDDIDEAEKEYNRLVPEYNRLIDYLKSVSDKFSLLQQQFTEGTSSFSFDILLNQIKLFLRYRIVKKQHKSLMNFLNVKITMDF